MTILVTGGGGFIGREVCRLLAEHGRDVLAVDRSFPSPMPCKAVQGDISSPDLLAGLLRAHPLEAVVHLAAVLNTASRERPDVAMRVNIGASLALLELAVQHEVGRFIFGSSISVYGPRRAAEAGALSESYPAAPVNVYGTSKRYVEIVGEQYRRLEQLQFVALRIAMAVGPGAANTASRWRSEIFEGVGAAGPTSIRLPYARHEHLPLIHVADVAACVQRLLAAARPAHAIYNTPADGWRCGDLADYIQGLGGQVELTFNPSPERGDPEAIDGGRFAEEFGFTPLPVGERLLRAAEGRRGAE